MAKATAASQLAKLVKQLQAERQDHAAAIAAIDASCAQLGITLGPAKRGPGRPKGSVSKPAAAKPAAKPAAAKAKAPKRRKRGTYKETAEQFVLGLLAGGKTLKTAEIVAKWRQTKRGGKADNTLSKLTAAKKVKRTNIKGARGSQYTLA